MPSEAPSQPETEVTKHVLLNRAIVAVEAVVAAARAGGIVVRGGTNDALRRYGEEFLTVAKDAIRHAPEWIS